MCFGPTHRRLTMCRPHLPAEFNNNIPSITVGMEDSPDLMASRTIAKHLGFDHAERIFTVRLARTRLSCAAPTVFDQHSITQHRLVQAEEACSIVETVIYHLETYEPELIRSVRGIFVVPLPALKFARFHLADLVTFDKQLFSSSAQSPRFRNARASLQQSGDFLILILIRAGNTELLPRTAHARFGHQDGAHWRGCRRALRRVRECAACTAFLRIRMFLDSGIHCLQCGAAATSTSRTPQTTLRCRPSCAAYSTRSIT